MKKWLKRLIIFIILCIIFWSVDMLSPKAETTFYNPAYDGSLLYSTGSYPFPSSFHGYYIRESEVHPYRVYSPGDAPTTSNGHLTFVVYTLAGDHSTFNLGNKSGLIFSVCTNDIGLIAGMLNENEDSLYYQHDTGVPCDFYRSGSSNLLATGTIWDLYIESDIEEVTVIERNVDNSDYSLHPPMPCIGEGCDQVVDKLYVEYDFDFMVANGQNYDIYIRAESAILPGANSENGTFYENLYEDQTDDGIRDTEVEYNTIFDIIKDLPNIFMNSIGNALRAAFIPTEQNIQDIITRSRQLSENFGFVGQSFDYFIELFTGMLNVTQSRGCATFPELKLGDNTLFSEIVLLQESNVCLADNPVVSNNISTIRFITSIVFISMFLTFSASQVFNILSKNSSGTNVTYSPDSGDVYVDEWQSTNGRRVTERRRY